MDWREIVAILVLIFVGIPLMIKVVAFSTHIGQPNIDSTTEEGAELITEAVTPWWLNLVNNLLEFGTPGALVVIALFWILKEAGVL